MWMMARRYDTTDRNAHIALGALIGAASGVVAGILFAPQSGSETRDRIRGKAHQAKDKASEQISHVKDKAADKMRSASERTADTTKSIADRTANRAKSAADRAQREADEQ